MNYALVILCGGSSTRMGSDKALLPFGNCCLIEYLVQKFKPHFSKIYLSVKKKGDYAHLQLPVTEIPDIYSNAGPMSGIFSGLSMIDEEQAFFMSVDTPFLEPQTGIALLDAMNDADICTIRGKAGYLETATAAYSKSCITNIGKCLLLRQFTFHSLREKCNTKYITENAIHEITPLPIDLQLYNLDTREDYYHALHMLSGIHQPDSRDALVKYFSDNENPFTRSAPVVSLISKPGTNLTPFLFSLYALAKREKLNILLLTQEHHNLLIHNMKVPSHIENLAAAFIDSDFILVDYAGTDFALTQNKVEVLKKGWCETPTCNEKDLIAILSDFPYESETGIPVFDLGKPRSFLGFLQETTL